MKAAFKDKISFNGDISAWDTSQVTDMTQMFEGAKSFNHDIGKWKTDKVVSMGAMLHRASSFDFDISGWSGEAASSVQAQMVEEATAFNAKFSCSEGSKGPAFSCMYVRGLFIKRWIALQMQYELVLQNLPEARFMLCLGNSNNQVWHYAQLGHESSNFNERSLPWFEFFQCGYFYLGHLW